MATITCILLTPLPVQSKQKADKVTEREEYLGRLQESGILRRCFLENGLAFIATRAPAWVCWLTSLDMMMDLLCQRTGSMGQERSVLRACSSHWPFFSRDYIPSSLRFPFIDLGNGRVLPLLRFRGQVLEFHDAVMQDQRQSHIIVLGKAYHCANHTLSHSESVLIRS
eukprot:scaffold55531_cov19-Tisochrysis_lutea.AAC.1